MNVLVVGSGGREHALVWKLRQSPSVSRVYCAPGNAGIAQQAELVSLNATDIDGLVAFAKQERIDLTVVGSEQPLVMGIVDRFEEAGLTIFGPTQAAARLEGSKAFAKEFMQRHNIPTARYKTFRKNERDAAVRFIDEAALPLVVKADGLAAGKGVLICETRDDANAAVSGMLQGNAFGAAGQTVVVEEFLHGEEVSVLVITDGTRAVPLPPAQDHKRALDDDRGKNTGGMGAYAPAPVVDDALLNRIHREVIEPTLAGMSAEGSPYRGCLYCGLMITDSGPKVLEYNCRLGDPEAQVVVPLLEGDFARLLLSAAQGALDESAYALRDGSAVCVVLASAGYPDEYATGKRISGLDSLPPGVVAFHAGTKRSGNDILTAGGRVLGITAVGDGKDLASTIEIAYDAVGVITFEGMQYRRDIGRKALRRLQALE